MFKSNHIFQNQLCFAPNPSKVVFLDLNLCNSLKTPAKLLQFKSLLQIQFEHPIKLIYASFTPLKFRLKITTHNIFIGIRIFEWQYLLSVSAPWMGRSTQNAAHNSWNNRWNDFTVVSRINIQCVLAGTGFTAAFFIDIHSFRLFSIVVIKKIRSGTWKRNKFRYNPPARLCAACCFVLFLLNCVRQAGREWTKMSDCCFVHTKDVLQQQQQQLWVGNALYCDRARGIN